MKIGKPVVKKYFERTPSGSKYEAIIEGCRKLKKDEWLPVETESPADARMQANRVMMTLRAGRHRHSSVRLTSHVEGNVVYFRVREE